MFQDMRNPRRIWRVRLEPNGEDIVLVISRKMEILGAGLIMLEFKGCELEQWNMLLSFEGESMQACPGPR